MKLLKTTAFILTTATATSAWAAQDLSFYEVEVKADLSDYSDSNALTYWPDLESDLQRAIVDRAELSGDYEDPRIKVLVSKVSVDGDTILPDSGEFNQLEGVVMVYEGESSVSTAAKESDHSDNPVATYPLRLYAMTADREAPEGWTMIPPSQDDFYVAMVEAFADKVVEDMEQ